ncbi:MAG: hypothetical protein ACO3JJ_10665 [Opitutaceae bacterium]
MFLPSLFLLSRPLLAGLGLLLVLGGSLIAQIPLPPPGAALEEDFNLLGTGTTAALPAGWRFSAAGDATIRWDDTTNVSATSAQASSGSPTAGGRYNWGQSATDRAPGVMSSSGSPSPVSLLAWFQNTLEVPVAQVDLTFAYERYRINTTPAAITFHHSADGVSWTAAPAGDSGAFAPGPSAYGFATPLSTVTRSVALPGLDLAPGASLYLRWTFDTGGANSQGLGLDNLSLATTAVPEPAGIALAGGAAALGAAWARRRRRRPAAPPGSGTGSLLDTPCFVRRFRAMNVNVRTFLRDFATCKAQARRGRTVRIRDREGEFLFTAVGTRRQLLGSARGKIRFGGDLTQPTLPDEAWKPSL